MIVISTIFIINILQDAGIQKKQISGFYPGSTPLISIIMLLDLQKWICHTDMGTVLIIRSSYTFKKYIEG